MPERIRILLVEDSEDDAALLLAALRREGYPVEVERVERADAFEQALAREPRDLILCDYALPGFGALAALEIAKRLARDTPFIIVSGSVPEHTAIEALRAGADDYVLKDNLIRLVPAIERSRREHRARVDRARAERALEESEERYRGIFEKSMIGLFRSTPDGRYLDANPALANLFGFSSAAEMIDSVANIPRQQVADYDARVEFAKQMAEKGRVEDFVGQGTRKDGSKIWVSMTAYAVRDAAGNVTHFEGSAKDVSDRVEAVQALRESEQRYRQLFDVQTDAQLIVDATTHAIEDANDAAIAELGHARAELLALRLDDLVDAVDIHERRELAVRRRDGSSFPAEVSVGRFVERQRAKLIVALSDISERIAQQVRLNYLAYYDALTGLPNRALLEDRLAQLLNPAARDGENRALMLFDLQRFARVNETLGRQAGDAALNAVAARLSSLFDRGATLARIGSDVFALALAEHKDAAAIAHFVEHVLLSAFAKPFELDEGDLRLAARVGIAIYPADGRDSESLLRNAETALKKARQDGQSYLFYAPEMNARVASALMLEHELRRAIERSELVLHYQPQVAAGDGRVVGFEALVRWQHPVEGLWLPGRFVPIAEELGLIVDLGRWVFDEACRQARAWLDAGRDDFTIAVNVSALQLRSAGFIDEAREAIVGRGLPPEMIAVELTESAIMEQIDRMSESLLALKKLGLSIALDDFGVGYSSLHYLKRLPVDKLKIDQSFVREITVNHGDAAIVRAIVAMGHQLNMRVMAEGVETAAQFGFLRRNHCDEIQGYFFGKALPPREAEALLRQRYVDIESFAATPQAQTLLLLDDDEHIIAALMRLLRREGYRIFSANNARDAFAILGREEVHVVISDQRMPDVSGTNFLNRVKDLYPETVRMVLSGYTDLHSVTDAINRGAIYKFLTKPWDDDELRLQIRDAFRTYAERRANTRAA